jgi:hypothetical protein
MAYSTTPPSLNRRVDTILALIDGVLGTTPTPNPTGVALLCPCDPEALKK